MTYPSWRYHKNQPAVIVNSAEEDAALGDTWATTPAAFTDPVELPVEVVAASAEADKKAKEAQDALNKAEDDQRLVKAKEIKAAEQATQDAEAEAERILADAETAAAEVRANPQGNKDKDSGPKPGKPGKSVKPSASTPPTA